MHQSVPQQAQLKEELSKFINLLQSNFSSGTQTYSHQQTSNCYPLTKKLSIILSASEPDSSPKKESSNPSADISFETGKKSLELAGSTKNLINSLMATSLTSYQLNLIYKIKEYAEQQDLESGKQNQRIQQLTKKLQGFKKTNEEIIKVLIVLDKQQQKLWESYNRATQQNELLLQKCKQIQAQLNLNKQNVNALQNDNAFMKRLIYHANQSYQALERKYKGLEIRQRSVEKTDRKSIKQLSTDNLLKSVKTKKNGHSPTQSSILRTPSPQNFLQIYRKMVIRTLKHKKSQKYPF